MAPNGKVKIVNGVNHDWPIFNPGIAAREINQFLDDIKKPQ